MGSVGEMGSSLWGDGRRGERDRHENETEKHRWRWSAGKARSAWETCNASQLFVEVLSVGGGQCTHLCSGVSPQHHVLKFCAFFRLTFILTTTEVSKKGRETVRNQEGKQTSVDERLVVYAMLAMRDTKTKVKGHRTIFELFACWGQDQWFLSLCELANEAVSLSNIRW